MPKRSQLSVTLGAYHEFVVNRMADRTDRSVSQVIAAMVDQWITDHQDVIVDNEATVTAFRAWKGEPS